MAFARALIIPRIITDPTPSPIFNSVATARAGISHQTIMTSLHADLHRESRRCCASRKLPHARANSVCPSARHTYIHVATSAPRCIPSRRAVIQTRRHPPRALVDSDIIAPSNENLANARRDRGSSPRRIACRGAEYSIRALRRRAESPSCVCGALAKM